MIERIADHEPPVASYDFTQPDGSVVTVSLPKHHFNVFELTVTESQGRNDGRKEGFIADPAAFGSIFMHILTTVSRQPNAAAQLDMVRRELELTTTNLTPTSRSELAFSSYHLENLRQSIVQPEPQPVLQCDYHDSFSGVLQSHLYLIPSDNGYTYCHTTPADQLDQPSIQRPTEGMAALAYQDIHMPWSANFAIADTEAWQLLSAMIYQSYSVDTEYSQDTRYSTMTLLEALDTAIASLSDQV